MLPPAGTQGIVMSSGGDTDETDPPVPPGTGQDGDAELLTSHDLFGSLVDAPLPDRPGGGASRKDPIRVQVSDPVTPGPFAALPEEAHDEEVDEAFSRLGGLVAESI